MAGLDEKVTLELNAEDLLRELAVVEQRAEDVENVVEEVGRDSQAIMNKVMAGVHAGWLATQGLVRAAGGSISTVFRTVIGSTLGAISLLTPILSAEMVTPGGQIQALMGFASIALAVGALVSAELEQREFSDALRGANMALHGVQSLIGVFSFI